MCVSVLMCVSKASCSICGHVCLPQNTLEKYKYTNTKLEYIHVPAVQIPARVGVAASALKSGSTVATVAHFGSFRPVIGF